MDNLTIRTIAENIHKEYSVLVDRLSEHFEVDKWSVSDIELQLKDFDEKYTTIYKMIVSLDTDWTPFDFNLNLHEYGKDGEYFIDITVNVSDIDINEEGEVIGAVSEYSLFYNDNRLYSNDTENETEEEMINRIIGGDADGDDEDNDKPWEHDDDDNNNLW